MAWFKKPRKPIAAGPAKPSRVPEGLWVKCTGCSQILYNKDLARNMSVCPKCGYHFRMGSLDRLRALFDGVDRARSWLVSTDPPFHRNRTPAPESSSKRQG
jgi:acetyl-CoA carboxylase beta subunit